MDSNTILLILFAVMMLFCCGGVGRLFSRRNDSSHCGRRDDAQDVATGLTAGKRKEQSGIDPTKVVRCALENAASVATLLLTSDALIAEKPKPKKKGHGHGGDYDMY